MVIENLISVIIPVYNIKIHYLESCIDSILKQTYRHFEIIIIDDGSCNECAAELEKVRKRDKRIFVFHKENEGVSVARNYGVKQARGEYIVYADGDDLLTPYYFESGIKRLKENNADIVIGKVIKTTCHDLEFSNPLPEVKKQLLGKTDLITFRQHIFSKRENGWGKDESGAMFNFEGCWAHIIRREVAEKEPFIQGIPIGEDTLWALQLSNYYKGYIICLVYEVWYIYLQNEGSVLHSYKSGLPDILTTVNEIVFEEVKTEPRLAKQYYDWLFVKLRQIIYNYLLPECRLNMFYRIKKYDEMMDKVIWRNIMQDSSFIPRQYKNKCRLFRSGLVLVYFKMRIRWKENR